MENYGPNLSISNISCRLNMTPQPQLKFSNYLFIANQLGSNYMQYQVITAYLCCKRRPLGHSFSVQSRNEKQSRLKCNAQPKH